MNSEGAFFMTMLIHLRQLRGWLMRLFGLFHRNRREREFAEELESHLAMRIEDNLFYERCSFARRATWNEKPRVITSGRVANVGQFVASVTCNQRSQRGRDPLWWSHPE
jgi:hypothetical protein